MARKNLIGISESPSEAQTPAVDRINDRPLAGFIPASRTTAPVGGITRTLGSITEKVERAQALERQLAEGQTIIELDPAQLESSFVNDRLSVDPAELAQLVDQIKQHGQQVPILVRPHPADRSRFQVAYGHRRVAAARQLDVKVRAVVRELTDDQLVVSQGQENNSRTDLSYIERALFASRLEDRKFGRDVIMSALGVDKAALSKMLGVVRQLPEELIVAVGAAPTVGRRRWMELADLVAKKNDTQAILAFATRPDHANLTSDQRFEMLAGFLAAPPDKAVQEWQILEALPVRLKETPTGATFVFNSKAAPGFDQFVKERLASLYTEYRQQTGE